MVEGDVYAPGGMGGVSLLPFWTEGDPPPAPCRRRAHSLERYGTRVVVKIRSKLPQNPFGRDVFSSVASLFKVL